MKRNYMYLCITFLILSIYVIFFPIIAVGLNQISPLITKCTYKEMTGKECPLCGGTRYIANISQALEDPTYLLHPFGMMMLLIIFELFFRIFCLIKIRQNSSLKNIVIFDMVLHSIVVILFFIYEISFILNS